MKERLEPSVFLGPFEKKLALIRDVLMKVSVPREMEPVLNSLLKELDRITINTIALVSASTFLKLNIESLQILIKVIMDHLKSEKDPVIRRDLTRLLIELEKILKEKEKNIN